MTEPIVYLNGQFLAASQAHLAIYDAGVVLGATVAEQTRTFHRRPWRLEEHLDRLLDSLRQTRLDAGLSKDQWIAISRKLLDHNAALLEEHEELGLIQFVTAGEYPTYAGASGAAARTGPTICVHTFSLPFELWARRMQSGASLIVPRIRHVPPQCYDPSIKHRSRLHFFLADQEARAAEPEAVALLLDIDGYVTETSTANFFMVEKGAIVSPTLRNILPGMSRAMVIELAAQLGIPFMERDFTPQEAARADEAFLSSTPYCLMPATKINGGRIGNGQPGPIYGRLLAAWSEAAGLDIARQIEEGAAKKKNVTG